MRSISLFLMSFFLSQLSYSQVTLNGTDAPNSTFLNAAAKLVDSAIVITGSTSPDGAKVSISANFVSGDVLGFSSGSLPTGVTGSYSTTTGVLTFTGTATPAAYQSLLRTVTFLTTSSSFSTRTILFNLGTAVSFSGTNHFYEFITGGFTWPAAYTTAAARTLYGLHGYLATIGSIEENNFIQQKLSADGWIGASDDYSYINSATGATTYANQTASEGKWYWVTGPEKGQQFSTGNGTPVVVTGRFMNWNTGEPNNSGTENFGEIYSTSSTGKWNDLGVNSLGYVVEYGGSSNDPVVDLTHSRNMSIGTSVQGSSGSINYTLKSTAVTVDNALTISSAASIADARVTISDNFQSGDVLGFSSGSLPTGVTGSYNATTGTLSFTGSITQAQLQTLFRTVTFSSTGSSVATRSITFSLGSNVAFTNGHFYEYASTATSWATAKTNATAKTYLGLTGYLATIGSVEENNFIQQKLSADGWIGASDDYSYINAATGATTYANQTASEGKWYWVTGPEAGQQFSNNNAPAIAVTGQYMNWNVGEPNNSGSNENFGEIYSTGSANTAGMWNDLGTTQTIGSVIEYGGLGSDPAVILSSNRIVNITAALPITGLQLEAKKNGQTTVLTWSTLTESNTDRFDILYSTNGLDYSKVGAVKAAGNSQTKQSYGWTHHSPAAGLNYYRLQQFDKDALFTYSAVVQVEFDQTGLRVYPNPFVNTLNIEYPVAGRKVAVNVLNSKGELVFTRTLTQTRTQISLAQLPPGSYVAQIVDDVTVRSIKILKTN